MGFARGFRKKYLSNEHANELNRAQRQSNLNNITGLLQAIDTNAASGKIDKTSAKEAKAMLGVMDEFSGVNYNAGVQGFSAASEFFQKALEGVDPKFKARRQTEILYKTMVDQPGRAQLSFNPLGGSARKNNNGLLGV